MIETIEMIIIFTFGYIAGSYFPIKLVVTKKPKKEAEE